MGRNSKGNNICTMQERKKEFSYTYMNAYFFFFEYLASIFCTQQVCVFLKDFCLHFFLSFLSTKNGMYPAYLSSFLFFLGRFDSAAALVAWEQVFRVFLLLYEGPSVLELCPLWVRGRRRRRTSPALSYGKGECAYYTSSGNENSLHLLPPH